MNPRVHWGELLQKLSHERKAARRLNKKPSIPFKLVMVEWEDSARPISDWQWIVDYSLPEIILCRSVGYLISDTDKAIALAPNLGDITQEKAQACGIFRIPRRAIIRISELKRYFILSPRGSI